MSSRNVELTREAFEAMNRRDVEWLAAHCHPDVELHMLGVAGIPVLYTGAGGIGEYFRDMDESWESFETFPEEIRDGGDRIVVLARQRLRGRTSGADVEITIALVYELCDGALAVMRAYPTVAEALAAAGLDESAT